MTMNGSLWPVSALYEGQLWVVLYRSCPRSVLVKSDANYWSGRMQMGGKVCAITHRVAEITKVP